MTPQTFVLLSGALTFGVPLVLAIRELGMLGGSKPRDEPPLPQRLPVQPKPLPECLLPRPVLSHEDRRVRVLEDA